MALRKIQLSLRLVVACLVAVSSSPLDTEATLGDDFNFPGLLQPLRDGMQFEYVVVGGGGAGAAAAARLALAGASVLLVEAGGDPSLLSMIPGAAMAQLGSNIDWQYETIPNNKSCLSSQGQQCRFARGKCLGGSTAINYMMYTRGNRHDFDSMNISGWAWDDVESYFFRYEGLQDLDLLPPSSVPYHNTSGLMRIEFFADSQNDWHSRIIEGMLSLNVPYNADVNAKSQIGVSQIVGYVYNGVRMSTARAYLTRSDVRRRLVVAKNTMCTGVIIDEDNVAKGITVVTGLLKRKINIHATREVILSAGTIGSAQLLMLSGVGPADHLRSLGIPVRADLPVGDNMSDHVLPLMLVKVDRDGVAADLLAFTGSVVQATQWLATRTGPLASNGLTDVTAFLNTLCYDAEERQLLSNRRDCHLPTLQLINAYVNRNLLPLVKPIFQHAIGLQSDVIDQISEANKDYALIVKSPVVLNPYSRGTVRLRSADPLDPPAIFPNYLSDERDVEEMLRSITVVEHLMETAPYKRQGAEILHLKLKGCPSYEEGREAYWRCYLRHMTYAVFHAVGTTALGGVVDESLRVRGVRRLRVADVGVLPQIPRGNTAAAAIAIGERVVDFLLKDNK